MFFKDVLADSELKQKLIDLAREGRIPHAQLFLAQPGSHALALAIALGQYLSCENPGEHDSCGVCPSCKQYANLAHPDLHLYFPNCTTKSVPKDPQSSLLINEFRDYVLESDYYVDINEWLGVLDGENKQPSINIRDCSDILRHNNTYSHQNGYKVYILWCADRLHHEAAPKILKTLEEPEGKSLFILITEQQDMLLNTIRSRTQLVQIPRLKDSEVAQKLQQMHPELSPEAVSDIAVLSDGNFKKAIHIATDNQEQALLLRQFETYFGSMVAFAQRQPNIAVQYDAAQEVIAEVSAAGREYQKQFVQLATRMLRNMLLMSCPNAGLLKVTHAEQSVLAKYQGLFQLKQITVMTDLCNTAAYHLARNGNAALVLTDLYFQLAQSFARPQ